ncbi:MAG: hypothetical protein GF331_05990 [Chitinivibrionales bacterium]|nr:hypothetical protein [Chitinivibrionales bacterium]
MDPMNTLLQRYAIAAVLLAGSSFSATITVDPSTEYQTIEGFGFAVETGYIGLYESRPQVIDMAVDDLGVSVMRIYTDPQSEPSNDNNDPFTYNADGFNYSSGRVGSLFNVMRRFASAGMDRFIFSPFTPPGWMKDMSRDAAPSCSDGWNECGGHLAADMYDEFGEYYASWVRAVQQEVGEDAVYAISINNEPAWPQGYISCVYTHEEMRDATRTVGLRLESEGIGVPVFGAEDLISGTWGPYYGYTMQDPDAGRFLHALAVHAYAPDGVTPTSGSSVAWNRVYQAASQHGKAVWMTETSGTTDTWSSAFEYATGIYSALKYGKVGLWIGLALMHPYGSQYAGDGPFEDGDPPRRCALYYSCRHFYRWVRPDALMIEAVSNDPDVLTLAFNHKEDNTLTVIAINYSGTESKVVSVEGDALPVFDAFRSSSSEQCLDVSSQMDGTQLSLPPHSIVTLFGTGYATATRTGREPRRPASAKSPADHLPTRLFSSNGRLVADDTMRRAAPGNRTISRGVYFMETTDSRDGRAAVKIEPVLSR